MNTFTVVIRNVNESMELFINAKDIDEAYSKAEAITEGQFTVVQKVHYDCDLLPTFEKKKKTSAEIAKELSFREAGDSLIVNLKCLLARQLDAQKHLDSENQVLMLGDIIVNEEIFRSFISDNELYLDKRIEEIVEDGCSSTSSLIPTLLTQIPISKLSNIGYSWDSDTKHVMDYHNHLIKAYF